MYFMTYCYFACENKHINYCYSLVSVSDSCIVSCWSIINRLYPKRSKHVARLKDVVTRYNITRIIQNSSEPEALRAELHEFKKKTIIWAAARQNQQNDMCSHRRVFAVRSLGSYGPKVSLCGHRRLWSDWADAVFAGRIGHFVGFAVLCSITVEAWQPKTSLKRM